MDQLMSRGGFLRGLAACGAAATAGCRMFTGAESDFDDSFAVFLSDSHVCGNDELKRWLFTRRELDARIAEILAMRPLPRNVVFFGDLAFGNGDIRDYRVAHEKFKLLTDAGIRVTLGMGNHDRRGNFLEVFPEYRKSTQVEGRIVSVVNLPTCDLVLLDSLASKDGEVRGAVGGDLGEAQEAWLVDYLAKAKRPTFVGAHHTATELKVKGKTIISALKDGPTVAGWINGHVHNWMKEPLVSWTATNQDTIRALHLPSAGLWGDIGYVEFRVGPTEAIASLVEKDYWFNDELHPNERKPEVWKAIVEENQGQFCRFPFARMLRAV